MGCHGGLYLPSVPRSYDMMADSELSLNLGAFVVLVTVALMWGVRL